MPDLRADAVCLIHNCSSMLDVGSKISRTPLVASSLACKLPLLAKTIMWEPGADVDRQGTWATTRPGSYGLHPPATPARDQEVLPGLTPRTPSLALDIRVHTKDPLTN
jgi:hypothetical protein